MVQIIPFWRQVIDFIELFVEFALLVAEDRWSANLVLRLICGALQALLKVDISEEPVHIHDCIVVAFLVRVVRLVIRVELEIVDARHHVKTDFIIALQKRG